MGAEQTSPPASPPGPMLLFWLLGAALVGRWAARRGRSGLGYFLLALGLSPLGGFLIVALLPKRSLQDSTELQLEKAALGWFDQVRIGMRLYVERFRR